MKDTFTVKEIMDGTGLTRQRVHALIKSRKIPVTREDKHFLLKWQDLLNMTDNATMLNFLKTTLEKERQLLEKVHDYQEENEKTIQFARAIEYARILVEGEPEFNTPENKRRWRQWLEAGSFFGSLMAIRNPAEESGSEPVNKTPEQEG